MLLEEVLPRMREGLIARRPGRFIDQYFTIAARYGSERLIATHKPDASWYTVQCFEATWLDNNWEIHSDDQIILEKSKDSENISNKPIDKE